MNVSLSLSLFPSSLEAHQSGELQKQIEVALACRCFHLCEQFGSALFERQYARSLSPASPKRSTSIT
jgi:hypothetical protein